MDRKTYLENKIRELKLEKLRRLTEEKFQYYTPNGKCEEFIKAVGCGDFFIVLFSAANGVGKCKPLTSDILMSNGEWKKLKDIDVGDTVIGHNYNTGLAIPSKVIQTSRAGIKDVYRFIFTDGGYVDASPEHSFPVKVRSGRKSKVVKMKVSELLEYKQNYVGGSIKFQQPKQIEFNINKELPLDPYLLGCLIGDGCLRRSPISFTCNEDKIMDKLSKIISKLGLHFSSRGCAHPMDYNIVRDNRSDKFVLSDIIKDIGLYGLKSGDKFIPQIYKTASVEDRKQLLAGLIDTDGTNKEYLTKSKILANDFCFLVKSLGGKAIMHKKIINNSFTHNKDSLFYRIYWAFDFELPLQLKRKQIISKRPIEYSNRFVKEIKYLGKMECGDIFIDHPEHCYISDDFISTGNTCVSANIVANIIWGEESNNEFFDLPLFKNWPYPKVGRIASNATNVEKNLIPTLKNWFPKGRYKTRKGNKSFESIWETDNGWMFDIMTYQQDPSEFESSTIGWAWFDEPPTEAIFKATIARLRKGGIIFISETPLNGSAWLYDYIVAGQNDDLKKLGIAKYIEADVESACKEHGLRGHLDHDVIQKQIASYSEEDKQARIYGKFQHLIGLRYKQFSRNIHIIKPFNVDPHNFCVYHALDTHPRNPDAALWIAVDRKGTKYIIDELYIKAITSELAQRIKMKNSQYRVVRKIIEPAAFIEDQHTGNCLATQLLSLGLSYIAASKERTNSDRRIEEALNYQKVNLGDHDEYIKRPELYIFDNCTRVIWEFEHYRWDEYTGRGADKHDNMEKTVDKDDHMIEDIGRILIQEPRFVEMTTPSSYPQEPKKSFDPYRR